MSKIKYLCISILLISLCSCIKFNMRQLTVVEQQEIISELRNTIKIGYVYEEKASLIDSLLQYNFVSGTYNDYKKPKDFGQKLEKDMLNLSRDSHIYFIFSPAYANTIRKRNTNQQNNYVAYTDSDLRKLRKQNYGFEEIEQLDNNIALLKITTFVDTLLEEAKNSARMSLEELKNSKAIILDLRDNSGGYASMVNYIASHFFEKKKLLSTTVNRRENKRISDWTCDNNGLALTQPLYVLVNDNTYSAAEALAYTLQQHKRAIIIGEKTAGGAHACERDIIWNHYVLQLPILRSEHPVSKTDWEKIGVIPDINAKSIDSRKIVLSIINSN